MLHTTSLILQFIPTTILQIDGVVGFSSAPEDRVVGGGESSVVVYCIGIFLRIYSFISCIAVMVESYIYP